MGDIAEMMLGGAMCESCGTYLGGGDGFPRLCPSCERYADINPAPTQGTAVQQVADTHKTCRKCGKRVKAAGLKDHQRDKHGIGKP